MLGSWWRRLWGDSAQPPDVHALARQYLRAAAIRGLPRGLIWKKLEPMETPMPAGNLLLVPFLASFEPAAGSNMEAVPAAREPRPIVGIFERRRGRWQPRMPPVFNHTIEQVAGKLRG